MRLAGKTAFVTGGRQGIGRSIVDAFRAEGAVVTTCGRGVRPEGLDDSVVWYELDVADAKAVIAIAEQTGGTDILVNNAGVQVEKTVVDSTDADWDLVIGANCRGVFNMCRAFIPMMPQGASIINIGSISGKVADPSMALTTLPRPLCTG
jgi:meso-butanediol dehydrogenase/(S,S)-butanediol dehydrogenase/diacetyl reductase